METSMSNDKERSSDPVLRNLDAVLPDLAGL